MAEEGETLGSVLVEVRDLLKLIAFPEIAVEPMSVVPRPKATGRRYGEATLSISETKGVVSVAAKTGYKLSPVCVIVRTLKASRIDVCLTPLDAFTNEIIAPGATADEGIFIHWFPYGIYTIGTSEGDRKFWIRAQGITEEGKAEAVIMYEEVI